MQRQRLGLTIGIILCTTFVFAEAPVSGWVTVGEDTVKPAHATALWSMSSGFGGDMRLLDIFMSPDPINLEGVDKALSIKDAIRDRLEGNFAILTLREDGSIHMVFVYIEDGSKNFGFQGGTVENVKLGRSEVSGRVWTEQEGSLGDTPFSYDISFSVPIVPEREPGKDLGASGGPAGEAYLAYVKAMHEGDVETLLAHLDARRAQRLETKNEDWRSYELDALKEYAPQEMKVIHGEGFGDWVILKVEGKDWTGDAIEGVVKMVKDGETWRWADEDLDVVW